METSYKTDTGSGTLSGSQLEVLPATRSPTTENGASAAARSNEPFWRTLLLSLALSS